jgi:predicted DNA-binding protein
LKVVIKESKDDAVVIELIKDMRHRLLSLSERRMGAEAKQIKNINEKKLSIIQDSYHPVVAFYKHRNICANSR